MMRDNVHMSIITPKYTPETIVTTISIRNNLYCAVYR